MDMDCYVQPQRCIRLMDLRLPSSTPRCGFERPGTKDRILLLEGFFDPSELTHFSEHRLERSHSQR